MWWQNWRQGQAAWVCSHVLRSYVIVIQKGKPVMQIPEHLQRGGKLLLEDGALPMAHALQRLRVERRLVACTKQTD